MTEVPAPVTFLVKEIGELLSAGSVGLYEFVWLLRSAGPDVSDSERRDFAREALRRLLDEDGSRLVLLEWPKEAELGEVRFEDLGDVAWDDPTEGKSYIAIARS